MTTPGHMPSWDERLQRRLARGEETALGELYDQLAPLVHGLAGRILADQAAAEQLTREVFAHLWTHPEAFDPGEGSLRSWLGALTHRRAVDRLRLNRIAALGVSPGRRPEAPAGAPPASYGIPSDDRPADERPSDAPPGSAPPPDGEAPPHPPAGDSRSDRPAEHATDATDATHATDATDGTGPDGTGPPGSGPPGSGPGESPRGGTLDEEIRAVATAARVQYVVDSLPHPLRETITATYYDGRTYQETAHRLGISEQVAKQRMRLGLQLLATELTEVRDEDGGDGADGTRGGAAPAPPAAGTATAGAGAPAGSLS